jgi:hypothetical protein
MQRPPLLVVTVGCLVVGVGLMVPFEATVPHVLGVAALFAFIVCGLFLIANPAELGRPDDESG